MKSFLESSARVRLAAALLLRELLRRRSAVVAAVALPFVFYAVVLATAPRQRSSMTLPILAEPAAAGIEEGSPRKNPFVEQLIDDGTRSLDERDVSLVFLGGAALGFLAAFFGFYIVYHRLEVDRRLVAAGYGVYELFLSRLAALIALMLPIAAGETVLAVASFEPAHAADLFAAYVLVGLVYGALGLLAGAVAKNELAGILGLVLLSNVDVGWLQNPAYYADSRSKWLIRALPAHDAIQLALASAFEEQRPSIRPYLLAVAACLVLVLAAATAYRLRARPVSLRGLDAERTAYFKITLVAYALWIIAFEIVGRHAATLPTHDPTSSWDRAIPLVPQAIWPYEACYLLPFAACFLIRDWHSMNIALAAALLANLVAAAAYLLFPVAFPRPLLGSSIAERVLALEYAWDFSPGANNLPSMHVGMSWLWLFACRKQGIGRPVELALTALVITISISTLLVKQHLLIDVLAGFACACFAWRAAHICYERKNYFAMAPLAALRKFFLDLPRARS